MKRLFLVLKAAIMIFSLTTVFAEGAVVLTEDFNDGSCFIKNASDDSNLSGNIIDADAGDEKYGKVFRTKDSSSSAWYIDLGKTFTAEDNNVARISFDVKAPMTANKNSMFYLADSANISTKGYDVYNSEYRKKAIYLRSNGNMGVNTDTPAKGSWYTSISGSTKAYTAGQWYHIEIVVDLYKQMATYYLDNDVWATLTYGDAGEFKSFDILGVYTESTNKTGYWYLDNFTVTDETVKVDESILFQTDFEKVSSGAEAGITFVYGEAQSAVEPAADSTYGNVLRFSATETVTSRLKVPVNATETAGKAISVSFDLYAETADKHYCMIYLYDTKGTAYKILCRNSNQASGKMGYFKFLNTGAPWQPVGTVAKGAGTWVHVDGIFEFYENQTVITWYFDGVKAGNTYSYALKDISYIRFNINKTETADVAKTFALDNILMRQYTLGSFTADYALTGSGAGDTLTILPLTKLANDFSAEDCSFTVTNSATGQETEVVGKTYQDGKLILTLNGLEYNRPYTVSATGMEDLFGQTMQDLEFYANPQIGSDNSIIPAIKAIWLYDYDGNRLAVKDATSEVSSIKILFNMPMDPAALKSGVTLGGLATDGSYSTRDNSYTIVLGGYLGDKGTAALALSGVKNQQGTTMADDSRSITAGDGAVAIKKVELITNMVESEEEVTDETTGEPTTVTTTTPVSYTAKVTLLNTSGKPATAVIAYGIYEGESMEEKGMEEVSLANDTDLETELLIPYTKSGLLKLFAWDKLGTLNPYGKSFCIDLNEWEVSQ